MSTDNLYKFAAENKLRFPSTRGELVVEDLFQMPLESKTGFDLNSVAKKVNGQLKEVTEESFVTVTTNPQKPLLTAKLEILKDVIATKLAANKAEADKREKAEKRRKLLDAIAAKQDQALTTASMDELKKQLDALDA